MFKRVKHLSCDLARSRANMAPSTVPASLIMIAACLAASLSLPARKVDAPIEAVALLERARAHRETFSADFPGFSSKLVAYTDGEVHEGWMEFRPPITLEVEFGDDEVRKAVKSTVRSLLAHRMAPKRSAKPRQDSVAYAAMDHHPLGRRVSLGDKYGSTYRIRDNRILEVDRNTRDGRLLISVIETRTTRFGNYLPTHFFVATFDKNSGGVKHSSAYSDFYQEIGGEYLPRSRQIISTTVGQTETLLVEWEEIELLSPVTTD